jgi:UrcA family protein
MFVRQFVITVAAVLATTVAVSSAVHAQDHRVDARVSYNPNELTTQAGHRAVVKRMKSAAYRACSDGGDLSDPLQQMRCARELSNQMIAKLPSAQLAARGPAGDKIASR